MYEQCQLLVMEQFSPAIRIKSKTCLQLRDYTLPDFVCETQPYHESVSFWSLALEDVSGSILPYLNKLDSAC